jgi:hypothetical protein
MMRLSEEPMDDQPTTNPDVPAPDTEPVEPGQPDASEPGYRPPRWAWFVLGGLAVASIVFAVFVSDPDLLFEDDFSVSGSLGRWLEDESSLGSMRYEEETYHVGVKQQGEMASVADLPSQQPSIQIGVDVAMVSGTGGLSVLCIADTGDVSDEIQAVNDRGEYYDFFLFFAEGVVAILRSDQLEAPLAVASTGMLRDGMNRVEVGCTGASGEDPALLMLTINGTSVLEHEDPGGSASFSAVGLTVYGVDGPAEAVFDNLVVSAP